MYLSEIQMPTSESGNLGTNKDTNAAVHTQISEYLKGTNKPTHYSTTRVNKPNIGKISTNVNCTTTSENTKACTIK
jgi:hypothetical protein